LGGANGALFVFDMTNFSTLEDLDFWYDLLIKHANGDKIPKILVGSKNDLLENDIDEELIEQFIRDRSMYEFIPTSALTNYNVLDVFKDITNLMINAQNLPYKV
jgi:GTPase SAR1 family protein